MQQRKALLEVREDKNGGTFVPNLLCVKVSSYASVLALLAKGNRNRAVRHTDMNVSSSRSHAILQLVLEQWPAAEGCAGAGSGGGGVMGPRPPAGTLLRSKLNFVDLAGSERWDKGATMGADRVTEMNAINGSLSALAGVVAALTGGVAKRHVPYRDSKLTHLLQDSLGGNCRTTIIATISPSADAFDESVSTLKFADRASAIGNNPVVNTSRDLSSVLALKEREINRLRQLLAAYMSAQPQLAPGPELPLKVLTAGPAWQEGLSSASTSPTRSRPSVSGWQATALGDEPESGASSGGAAAEQLLNELMELRRALDMERALRIP
ncbi:kinesin motor domain-containing protein [Haematococcus lacustris]|uniref:Kinesin-like protein n=1 Tax=Haematococcus lacustris TaxID=44745 RepID=A0A699ZB94_HAELA|nr:kinesin motor domain-containing protein [Haematococcus lacustris]